MVDEPKPLLEYLKNALLVLVSTSVAIVVCAIGGEVIMDVQYERWRSDGRANISHGYGGLTMISENPNLMWEYRPNAVSNDPNMVEIRTNQHGFREHHQYNPDHSRTGHGCAPPGGTDIDHKGGESTRD